MICGVSGAALIAAQQNGHINQQIESGTIKSLQDLVQALQEQLENEVQSLSDGLAAKRITNQRLETSLAESLGREKILREQLEGAHSLAGEEEKVPKSLYPSDELQCVRKVYLSEEEGAVM